MNHSFHYRDKLLLPVFESKYVLFYRKEIKWPISITAEATENVIKILDVIVLN